MVSISFGGRNYVIGNDPISQGGHCDIYLAEDSRTGEKVVYRKLRENSDAHRKLFDNGVTVLKMLNRINMWRFPKLYVAGDGWCAREFVEGILLPYERRSEKFTLSVAYHAADALSQFVRLRECNGVTREPVHRDIKPANIMITREGDLYIIDVDTAWTNGNDVARGFGTPRYRSPEQQNNVEESPKSDIFSLGITLYETLTGKIPGRSVETKKIEKYDFETYRGRVLRKALSVLGKGKQISEVIRRCLRENGEYESAEEMKTELRERLTKKGLSVRESRLVIGSKVK